MTNKKISLIACIQILLTLASFTFVNEANATVACLNRLSGTYNFGVAPYACNVSTYYPAATITGQYSPVIYDDSKATATARLNYMSNMYPVLREVGKYYIQRRNPKVSAAEVEGFVTGLYALAMQESVYSHYRVGTDKIVRFMRGDSLHGYGFMQVDDRSHASDIAKGAGADLMDNMIYGLGIYYDGWVRSATASCIGSPSDYENRARSAWAAYNAGPASLCRWKKTNTHDTEYLNGYTKQTWRAEVRDLNAASPLNVTCLAEGKRPCALPSVTKVTAAPVPPVVPVLPAPSASHEYLSAQISYRLLRSCGAATCSKVAGAIRASQEVAIVSKVMAGWVEVASMVDGHRGWLKTTDLVEKK